MCRGLVTDFEGQLLQNNKEEEEDGFEAPEPPEEKEVICIFLIHFLACYLHIYIGFQIIEKLLK